MAQGSAVLTEPRRTRRGLWSWVLLAVVAGVGAYLVVRDRHNLAIAFSEIGWGAMALSAMFAVLGTVLLLGLWMSVLRGLAVVVPLGSGWRVFFISQLGKYLPGLLWPALAQMEAGRRWGARRSVMLAANLLMVGVLTGTGLVLGLVMLPGSVGLAGIPSWTAWMLAGLLVVICLWPHLLTRVVDRVYSLFHREPPNLSASPRDMAISFAWATATWLLYGMHVWVLVRSVGGTGADAWVAATGGIALGWALGLLAVFAPAGVGVRDAALIAVLSPIVGGTAAFAVALASRGLLALTDVALAAVAAIQSTRGEATSGVTQE